MRASTCKGCGAAIVWIRTPGGKSMPLSLIHICYKMKSWVENRGLPVHTKKVNRCSFRVVYICLLYTSRCV